MKNLPVRTFNELQRSFFDNPWSMMRTVMNDTFRVDVREAILHYIVEAELPGVKKEDIDIDILDGTLTIRVTQNCGNDDGDDVKVIQKERCVKSMERNIYLPDVKETGITAGLKDGILRISVPKDELAKKKSKIKGDYHEQGYLLRTRCRHRNAGPYSQCDHDRQKRRI